MEVLKSLLLTFLEPDQVLDSRSELLCYDTDATSLLRSMPGLVTMPKDEEEVSRIVLAINRANIGKKEEEKIHFIPRGAGTGLSGGVIGNENSVIISLTKLDQIEEIDTKGRRATVGVGLINAVLNEKLKGSGLHFVPDPSSQQSCTIGGNVAENAGGIHCFKYGVTADHVLGLEVVMPNGDLKYFGDLSQNPKTNSMDLTRFFIGSEGTLGIITKVMVRLTPVPESFYTFQIAFNQVESCTKLIAEIIKQGFEPSALEFIDTNCIKAVDKAFNLGFEKLEKEKNTHVNAILLLELDGDKEEVVFEASQVKKLIEKFEPILIEETQDKKRRAFLWQVRKGVAAAFGQIAPSWYLYDIVVPRSKIPIAMKKIQEIADKHELTQASIIHAAEGNLHPNFLYDADKDKDVIERIHAASKEINTLCVELGGTLSGEHGIGLEKRDYMDLIFSKDDMRIMYEIKKLFDLEEICNYGKIIPINICKECHGTLKAKEATTSA